MKQHAYGLSIRNLTKRYGTKTVVDNVTLDVEPGKFLTLLGPSGSGKTSILMMIAGFIDPSDGEILLDRKDITAVPAEKREFGMVFQGYALFPHLDVDGNVGFPLAIRRRPHEERLAKVKTALAQVQLSGFGKRVPKELSGGQQQRVALARALVFSPHILLLDEPLSALDKKLRTDLQAELRQLHRDMGMTFICVTHDQEEALSMSDEVAVLRDGQLIQVGAPRTLYERPVSHFVASFLGESNFIEGVIASKDRDSVMLRVADNNFRQIPDRQSLTVGDAVMIALRLSRIQVSGQETSGTNSISGQITDVTYRGDRTVMTMRTQVGVLRAEDLTSRLGSFGVGQNVWALWEPDAGVIVADDRIARG